MFEALQPHQADNLRLHLHRARSVVLTPKELIEVRAAQRTFEGAYMRTALSQFSFALIILKIFTSEFYPIGALFAVYGSAVLAIAIYRRYEGNRQFFHEVEEVITESVEEEVGGGASDEGERMGAAADVDAGAGTVNGQGGLERAASGTGAALRPSQSRSVVVKPKFRTSGDSILLLALLSLAAYITLLVLTMYL